MSERGAGSDIREAARINDCPRRECARLETAVNYIMGCARFGRAESNGAGDTKDD